MTCVNALQLKTVKYLGKQMTKNISDAFPIIYLLLLISTISKYLKNCDQF